MLHLLASEGRALPLLLFGLLCGCTWTEGSVQQCFTFYSAEEFGETSAACKEECPYRTTCEKDSGRSTCVTSEQNCKDLLPRGQLISGWVNYSNGSAVRNYTCQSCFLNGCKTCAAGINSTVTCQECDGHFELDGKGGCKWKESYWGYVMLAVIAMTFLLGLWVLIDFLRAECSSPTNSHSIEHGLLMRRRGKVLRSAEVTSDDGSIKEAFAAPSFFTNLFSVGSSEIAGPGTTLFMNWWLYTIVLSLWLALGALILAPSADEELEYIHPCRQQALGEQGQMILKHPAQHGREGPHVSWTMWNFISSVVITVAFFVYQEVWWSRMVRDWKRPALQEYCIELSNMPPDLIDKGEIRQLLGNWMLQFHLDPAGIRHISIAYNIPADRKGEIEDLMEMHLQEVAASRVSHFLLRHGVENMDDTSVKRAGPFWVQLGAHVLLQSPLDLGFWKWCSSVPVADAGEKAPGDEGGAQEKADKVLNGLQGSGYVYVLMDSEALALSLAGMGIARLHGVNRPIRVKRATMGPEMVRWFDYVHVPLLQKLLRIAKVTVVLLVVLGLWLGAFAFYLSFELVTMGDSSYKREFLSMCVVGLSVPIGNAIFGVVIELQTETIMFKDEENLRLCRLVLNVILNAAANFGEIYLVFKKVFDPTGWKIEDVPWEFAKALQPVSTSPYVTEFHTQLRDILWPFGLLIPIFMLPCVETLAPFLLGRLRLKQDGRLKPLDAERLLKPPPVDIVSNYSDMLINITLVTAIFWISPGRYNIILWFGVAVWAVLQGIVMQLNILWWQAHGYVGGKDSHQCTSHLLSLPLGIMCAGVERQWDSERSGVLFFLFYCTLHFIFLQYVLPHFFQLHDCWGTRLDEMMEDKHAPIINYRNTNPIEVLQACYQKDESLGIDRQPLIFYRHDKWYLQKKGLRFEGEQCVKAEAHSILTGITAQARNMAEEFSSRTSTSRNSTPSPF